jgi:hypothetical protein
MITIITTSENDVRRMTKLAGPTTNYFNVYLHR